MIGPKLSESLVARLMRDVATGRTTVQVAARDLGGRWGTVAGAGCLLG